jgi:hypothetical protein
MAFSLLWACMCGYIKPERVAEHMASEIAVATLP